MPSSGGILTVSLYTRYQTFQMIYLHSLGLFYFSVIVSFVWREYSLTGFEPKTLNIVLHVIHYVILTGLTVSYWPMSIKMFSTDQDVREYMNIVSFYFSLDSIFRIRIKIIQSYKITRLLQRNISYHQEAALFVILRDKEKQFLLYNVHTGAISLLGSIYVIKAIYRVRNYISFH